MKSYRIGVEGTVALENQSTGQLIQRIRGVSDLEVVGCRTAVDRGFYRGS